MLSCKELDQSLSEHQIFMDVFSRRSVYQSITVMGDSGCFVTRNIVGNYRVGDHDTSAKRMKRSDGKPYAPGYSNGDLLIAEKAPVQLSSSKEMVLSVQSIDLFSNYPSCPLVESSKEGVFSTNLHTRLEEVRRRRGHAWHGDASTSKSGNLVAESNMSLVSQHSITPDCSVGDAIITTLLNKSLTDLCRRLCGQVNELLKAAGWVVKKEGKSNKKTYKSSTGEKITRFYELWDILPKRLFAYYRMTRQGDVKQWKNVAEFSSDLSEALMDFVEVSCSQMEASDVLFQQWSILDPFVTVIMVKRQIGILRKGKPVKAATTVVSDLNLQGPVDHIMRLT